MRVRTTGATCAATVALVLAVAAPASAGELGKEGGFTYVKKSAKLADTTSSEPAGSSARRSAPTAACRPAAGRRFRAIRFDRSCRRAGPSRSRGWAAAGT